MGKENGAEKDIDSGVTEESVLDAKPTSQDLLTITCRAFLCQSTLEVYIYQLIDSPTMFGARHAADNLRLRFHRARSVDLTANELDDVRSAQRTFEGAYVRTSLSQFSFSLAVLKVFTSEFYSIGALFAAYGAVVFLVSAYRRQQGNKQFFNEIGDDGLGRKKFRTSGNVVVLLTALTVAAYGSLLVLTLRLLKHSGS